MPMPLDNHGELIKDYAKRTALKKLKKRISASHSKPAMNGAGKGHGERAMDKMQPESDKGNHGMSPLAKSKKNGY